MAPQSHSGDESFQVSNRSDPRETIEQESSTYLTDQRAEQCCQIFAEGLDSGLGYERILSLLESNNFASTMIESLRTALLQEGSRLGEAFVRFGILDSRARTLVIAAERQGKLPETFEQLSQIYGDRYKRKKELALAFVEPTILFSLSIILIQLVGHGLTDIGLEANWRARAWQIALDAGLQIGAVVWTVVTTLFVWLNLPVDWRIRDIGTRLWLRLPVISRARWLSGIALFCRYLEQSIASGLSIRKGLELASEASQDPRLMSQIDESIQQIKEGSGLAEALSSASSLPDKVIEHIEIGEASGRLEQQLGDLTETYETRAEERLHIQMNVLTWVLRYGIIIAVVIKVFQSILTLDISMPL